MPCRTKVHGSGRLGAWTPHPAAGRSTHGMGGIRSGGVSELRDGKELCDGLRRRAAPLSRCGCPRAPRLLAWATFPEWSDAMLVTRISRPYQPYAREVTSRVTISGSVPAAAVGCCRDGSKARGVDRAWQSSVSWGESRTALTRDVPGAEHGSARGRRSCWHSAAQRQIKRGFSSIPMLPSSATLNTYASLRSLRPECVATRTREPSVRTCTIPKVVLR